MEDDKKLFADRKRTNLLNGSEQRLISYMVPRVPNWISSDGLTAIGLLGSVLILISFILAKYVDTNYLLLGILGFIINWVGDSMDGRVAYYRNKSRKWYGFSLDVIMDWISTVMIGLGYVIYSDGYWELTGFLLVACYGWSMIISQLRYKIADVYTIDAGIVGPTEIRVAICLVLLSEVLFTGAIDYLVVILTLIVFIINLRDTKLLLNLGDQRDNQEKNR